MYYCLLRQSISKLLLFLIPTTRVGQKGLYLDIYDKKNAYICYPHVAIQYKAEFTHPVSACICRTALRFFINYLGFAQPRLFMKNCNAMQKTHAESGCVNEALATRISKIIKLYIIVYIVINSS